jgi:hypothetical protein
VVVAMGKELPSRKNSTLAIIASDIDAVALRKISESCETDEGALVASVVARARLTVTMLETVDVLVEALAPVVTAEVSVTVAVSV